MKKLLAVLVALFLVLGLIACGGGQTEKAPENTEAKESTEGGEEVSDEIREHVWSLGMDSPKDTVTYYYGEVFAEELDKLSGGKMRVDLYPDATLGGDVALLESCHGGNVTFVIQTTAPQVNFIPQLAVFDLPMVYPTIEEFREMFDNEEFMEKISGFYADAGYRLMGYADQTFRVMSSNKKVESMEDFKGIKIRTMENPYHMDFWKSVGASPTPMAFSELYTGLQQGTVAAQENPYATIAANKLHEVQDYIIQTNHLPHILSLIMYPGEYDALNDAEKEVLNQAVAAATIAARNEANNYQDAKTQEIADSGTEIVPVSDELYAQMKEAAQPVYDEITEAVGKDLVDMYLGK